MRPNDAGGGSLTGLSSPGGGNATPRKAILLNFKKSRRFSVVITCDQPFQNWRNYTGKSGHNQDDDRPGRSGGRLGGRLGLLDGRFDGRPEVVRPEVELEEPRVELRELEQVLGEPVEPQPWGEWAASLAWMLPWRSPAVRSLARMERTVRDMSRFIYREVELQQKERQP